jgi:hypothetical protein
VIYQGLHLRMVPVICGFRTADSALVFQTSSERNHGFDSRNPLQFRDRFSSMDGRKPVEAGTPYISEYVGATHVCYIHSELVQQNGLLAAGEVFRLGMVR